MSSPSAPSPLSVRPEAVTALATELAALSDELSDDAVLCRAAAVLVYAALSADEGLTAGSAATVWATLTEAVAGRTAAVAVTLLGALSAYRGTDAALASAIATGVLPERIGGR